MTTTQRGRRLRRFVSLAVLGGLLAACGGDGSSGSDATATESEVADVGTGATDTDSGESSGSDADTPEPTGATDSAGEQADTTLRVAVSNFSNDTLDPAMEVKTAVLFQQLQLWDSLLEIAPDGSMAPGVAESWELDDSGLVWTFHLRPGIQFHDGNGELTATDVKFSLERFTDERSEAASGVILAELIDSIEVVDDYTVEITLNRPSSGFLYFLSPHQENTGIIFPSKYLLDNAGEDFEAQSRLLDEHPIGSGPFKFVERVRGDYMVFEAVEDHWRSTPDFKRVEMYLVPEGATQMAMLRSGEVDLINLEPDQIVEAEGAGMEIYRVPRAVNIVVMFPGIWRNPALAKPQGDPMVRRALSLAIDRQLIADTLLQGEAELPATPFNTQPATSDIDVDDWTEWAADNNTYDPEEARRLLAEAGYPDGFEIEFNLVVRPGAAYLPQLGEIVAAMWSDIGVEARLNHTEYADWRETYVGVDDPDYEPSAGDPGPFATSPRWDSIGIMTNFWSCPHCGFLNDADLMERFAEADATIDADARAELVRGIFADINERYAIVPLFDSTVLFAANPDVIESLETIEAWPYLSRVLDTITVVR